MQKLSLETPNMVEVNIEKIATWFPNCLTEILDEERTTSEKKVYKRAINFEILKQMLSKEIVDGAEAYEFTWVGKKASMVEANRPIRKTLRPCKQESVNWDVTENLYIEGDNLDVLKLLQESYHGQVKMIYIDPPYNTGHDFVYPDSFMMGNEQYNEGIGYFNADGNVNFKRENNAGYARYHSDWCSMMYSRLILARKLLSEDGAIFISIDDHEQANIKKICNEVLGESNFVANLVWANKEGGGSSDSKHFRIKHEYILCYGKNKDLLDIKGLEVEDVERYRERDEYFSQRGPYQLIKLDSASIQYSENLDYDIDMPDGTRIKASTETQRKSWRWSKEKLKWGLQNGYVVIKKDRNENWAVYTKQYLNADNEGNIINRSIPPMGIIEKYSTTQSNRAMKEILGGNIFSYSKPVPLLCFLISRMSDKNAIILDFFSGSSSTAHAVMELNAQDGGNRKFIMVQLPEIVDEKSEAYKAGYKNICEIGKERIRRVGRKIVEENGKKEGIEDLDIGFRVLKLDDSNMKDVYYSPSEYTQDLLSKMESNIKEDRSDLDLLFGCLLDRGMLLSLRHQSEMMGKCTVHNYNDGDLIACFDEDIPSEVIREIAGKKPRLVIFRDASFADSPSKINVYEIFKFLSPESKLRVI